MPVDRFFHPRAGHSRKVTALSDLEFRVWWTYQMAADDYGVMRRSPIVLQAANDSLARRSSKAVDRALDRVVDIGLLVPFEHQDEWYVCQLDWQDFQRVRWPRASSQPTPTSDVLSHCSGSTRELFLQRLRITSEVPPEESCHVRAREEANANGLRLTANGCTSEDAESLGKTQISTSDSPRALKKPEFSDMSHRENRGAVGRSDGVFAGQLPKDHVKHAACDPGFAWCVPMAVHAKLVNKLAPKHSGDREAASAALKAWYPTVWRALPADFVISGDDFKFWQARFDETFATPDPRTATPTRRLIETTPEEDGAAVLAMLQKERGA